MLKQSNDTWKLSSDRLKYSFTGQIYSYISWIWIYLSFEYIRLLVLFIANPYPNVPVALDMDSKVSGSFKNAKSQFEKDFYAKISYFSKKPKHKHWQGFFSGFYGSGFLRQPWDKRTLISKFQSQLLLVCIWNCWVLNLNKIASQVNNLTFFEGRRGGGKGTTFINFNLHYYW